jgi:pyruvate formate-lyase activating enzyme-like uncharacterized protein
MMAAKHAASPRRLPMFTPRDLDTSLPMTEQLIDIRLRQRKIDNLVYDNGGLSAHWGGTPSPGCAACKANRWVTVFVGKACNAVCAFCPQPPKPKLGDPSDGDEILPTSFGKMPWTDVFQRITAAVTAGKLDAVGYSGGEPLMYVERIVRFATSFRSATSHLYQYAYTNGILGSREIYATLQAAGIRELRFDLAATDFSAHVINNMASAHEYFSRVTIEIPALPDVVEPLRRLAPRLPELGVSQINLCEVVVNEHNVAAFKDAPMYKFNPHGELEDATDPDAWSKWSRLVPRTSRHATYDVISTAQEEAWSVVINDCAQGVHYKPELPL